MCVVVMVAPFERLEGLGYSTSWILNMRHHDSNTRMQVPRSAAQSLLSAPTCKRPLLALCLRARALPSPARWITAHSCTAPLTWRVQTHSCSYWCCSHAMQSGGPDTATHNQTTLLRNMQKEMDGLAVREALSASLMATEQ